MNQPAKALVLGASGFVGSSLVRRLMVDRNIEKVVAGVREQSSLVALSGSSAERLVLDYDDQDALIASLQGFDIVFDATAGGNPASSNRSIPEELSSIQDAARLIDTCCEAGVGRYVFLSSGGAVYGSGDSSFAETDEANPLTTYGLRKLAIEKLLCLYEHQKGLDYRVARLSNPYGPFQRLGTGQGAVAVFIDDALNERDIDIFGDGSVVRDFIYIDDAADCIVRIAQYDGDKRIFNVGSGTGTSIGELASMVKDLTASPSAIVFNEGRTVDSRYNVLNMRLFRDEIGSQKMTPLCEGIGKTIDFQRSQRNEALSFS